VLDYQQVERAVVFHAQAQDGVPALGNGLLMEELAGHPRLLPSWVVMPHWTGEMPEPDALVAAMLARGVRVARLHPGAAGHGFSLEPWCAGPLLEALAAHRIPVILDFMLFRRADPDWRLILDLCGRYPALPLVLTGAGIGRASRTFYALCRLCPNLHIELSRYTPFRGVEALCRMMGATRLLYGSGLRWWRPALL